MRGIFALTALLYSTSLWATSGFDLELAKKRCPQSFEHSKKVYGEDLPWKQTPEEMAELFNKIYHSGKRLSYHSTYNPQKDQFFLHIKTSEGFFPVAINETFIKSVTQQIEVSLQKGYADHVFFSDMGHSHLYFPQAHWNKEYADMEVIHEKRAAFYSKAFADPKMRPLYHTCEQLKMRENDQLIADEYLQFRYWNRNVVGYNDGSGRLTIETDPDSSGNTVSGIDGYQKFSAGFHVSASHKGCFPYRTPEGKILFFDIGMEDLERDPNSDPIVFRKKRKTRNSTLFH